MPVLTKRQIDKIKARCKKADWWRRWRGFPNAVHLLIGDVPALLDALETLQTFSARVCTERDSARLELSCYHDFERLVDAAQAKSARLRSERDVSQAENARLREALKDAARICRLQRKNFSGEADDPDKAYAAWTDCIEEFEALSKGDEWPQP